MSIHFMHFTLTHDYKTGSALRNVLKIEDESNFDERLLQISVDFLHVLRVLRKPSEGEKQNCNAGV